MSNKWFERGMTEALERGRKAQAEAMAASAAEARRRYMAEQTVDALVEAEAMLQETHTIVNLDQWRRDHGK